LPADQPTGAKNRCADDKEREDPADAAQAHGLNGLIADADIVHGVSLTPPRLSFVHGGAKRKARRSLCGECGAIAHMSLMNARSKGKQDEKFAAT
jgi:hypothetical protein